MFDDLASLLNRFKALGAVRAFCKPLAENDNSKQQIYLGASLEVVQMFPFEQVEASANGKNSAYKAKLKFLWVDRHSTEQAAGAQLILYPQYPEIRLSGFLRGCKSAPNEALRPIPANLRCHNNGMDGRILFFGITRNGETLAYLASAESLLSREFRANQAEGAFSQENIFFNLPLLDRDSKFLLLQKLTEIRQKNWQPSIRLNSAGEIIPYMARNGGGYTLEALLGIIPNGRAEPDFFGWEMKAYSRSRITLMTPEPEYGEAGIKNFIRKFGKSTANDTWYFTGTHRVNCRNIQTGLTLSVRGFNSTKQVIEDVDGAVELLTDGGQCAAAWPFGDLMVGWNKKHAQAAYVRYESDKRNEPSYRYLSPVLLGEGTDFSQYLASLCAGNVIFDPGSKIMGVSTERPTVKARSQFRMSVKHLAGLYKKFEAVSF